MFSVFIFDMDGTLIRSAEEGREILKRIVADMGYAIPIDIDDRIKRCWAYGDLKGQIISEPFGIPDDDAERALEIWKDADVESPRELIQGVHTTIDFLRSIGCYTAILTSRSDRPLNATLKHHNLRG